MIEWIELLGIRSWEGLWLPICVWTVPAGLVWLAVRRTPIAAGIGIQLLQASLIALPVALALAAVRRASRTIDYTVLSIPMPAPIPTTTVAAAPADYSVDPVWTAIGLLTIIALLCAIIGTARLIASAVSLMRVRRASRPVSDPALERSVPAFAAALGFKTGVEIRCTPEINTPMSAGILKPVILMPEHETENLDLIVLHELVHHRRRDVVRLVVSRMIRAVFFVHPLTHALGRRLDALIEIDCDTEVVAASGVSPKTYAALLLRYAISGSQMPLALKLGSEPSMLKKRIEAMHHPAHTLRSHPVAVTLGVILLGLVTTIAACTDSFVGTGADSGTEVSEAAIAPKVSQADADAFVVVEEMPTLIGGLEAVQSRIRYPEIAKRAGVEGRVFVQFVVNEEGVPENIVVTRGIGAGADEEAVRVVSTMRFEPGRQGGKTVPVKMSLPVTFRLGDEAATEQTSMTSLAGLTKMSGRVLDARGEPVPFANVWIEGTERGASTDENGNFFVLAEPGDYDVRVSGKGFKTQVLRDVSLQTGFTRHVDVTLDR
ncbi:MAG: TonB family protein [Rhodothermales bacterium]|nr:TonB family protein [Rhodothermales bacterium]